MAGQWHYSRGTAQLGPVSEDELRRLIDTRAVGPSDMVWTDGMPEWKPARTVPALFPDGVPDAGSVPPPPDNISSTKLAAGLCAIFVGSFGVHKFILKMNNPGIIMLLVTLATCFVGGIVMHIISIVEGITYLTMSDEKFYETYIVGKKEWF